MSMLEVLPMFQDIVETAANVLEYGFRIRMEVLSMFQDMVETVVNVSGYGGNCCQCFRIWWKLLPMCWDMLGVLPMFQDMIGGAAMFQDMVETAVNVSGYGGDLCPCFIIWTEVLSVFQDIVGVLPLFKIW